MRRRSCENNPDNTENRTAFGQLLSGSGTGDLSFGLSLDILKKWPTDESGKPVPPVFLTRRSGLNFDDTALVAMFDSFGIPCLRRYPGDGDFGRLIFGVTASGVDIFVPAVMLDDAKAILEGEPVDED